MRLMCSHVFCHSCLKDFWGFHIAEGSVEKVGCPHSLCIKEGREAAEDDVLRVVSEEEVKRWRWLREKRSLEKGVSVLQSFSAQLIHLRRSHHRALSAFVLPNGDTKVRHRRRRI
jgi:hypothetical protein